MRFDYRKATQALSWLAQQHGGSISKLHAMKLLFFVDRYHLRKYGRTVTDDAYLAMQYGPVPANCKDLAELNDFLERHERDYAARYLSSETDSRSYRSVRSPDMNVLSETDREALQAVWAQFRGHLSDLVSISHLFPEWKRHEAAAGPGRRVDMDLADFLSDAPEAAAYELVPLTPEQRAHRETDLRERAAVNALWS